MSQLEPQELALPSRTALPPEQKPSTASSSARLVAVPAQHVERIWPYVAAYVDAACKEAATLQTAEQIKAKILDRDMQLWAVRIDGKTVGAVVTEIYDTAAGKTCGVPIVGGDGLGEWLHLLSVIEAWAKAHGCVRSESVCRSGWERVLRRYGWEKKAITVARTL